MLQKIVANFVWSYDKLHKISLGVFITKKSNLKKLWKRTRGLTLVKMPLVIKGFERKGRVLLPKGGAAKKGEKVPPTVPQIGHFLIIQENRAEKRQSCRSRQNRTNWRSKVALITRDGCLSKMQCWFLQLASLVEEKCTFLGIQFHSIYFSSFANCSTQKLLHRLCSDLELNKLISKPNLWVVLPTWAIDKKLPF